MKTTVKVFLGICLFVIFIGCSLSESDENIEVSGNWELINSGSYTDGEGNTFNWYSGENWEITDKTINYLSTYSSDTPASIVYSSQIIYINNSEDFAIIRFTNDCSYGYGKILQYSIFKWRNNSITENAVDFTQAYNDSGLDEDGDSWNDTVAYPTALDALADASDDSLFARFSEGATRE